MTFRLVYLGFFASLVTLSPSVSADDWPHWMGPSRDNAWREDGLLEKFPSGGPKILWRSPVHVGYAGPSVAGGRVFVLDYRSPKKGSPNFERKKQPGTERVLCLSESTGKELWSHEYPVVYSISYPFGPRCTPTVDGDRVYTLGAHGHLFCFDVKTGKILWSKDFAKGYGATPALWGYTNHPLVDGDKLICIVGGNGSHAVAFDKKSGKELWRTITAKEQGYCPPVIYEAGGVRQLVLLRADGLSAVNPETGKEYWSLPYDATSGSVIMTPVRHENFLFMGGFSNKNLLVELDQSAPKAKVAWRDLRKKAFSAINVQPFLDGKTLYGFGQKGELHAVNLRTGDRLWSSTAPIDGKRAIQVATAFIVKATKQDRFWLFNERGELIIAQLTRKEYREIDRAKVIEPTGTAFGRRVVWSAPAFANRHAYVRNDKEIICVDLSR
ncbi:MAG: PQQ-binding-like beta-propeller repeat protein [Planctomycetota bacterium]